MSFRDLAQLRRRYAGQAGMLIDEFYLPVLGEAVRYDRQAGYFDSVSLVQIAAGLAAFIQRVRQSTFQDPPMRLITGATWGPYDIAAYQRGIEALKESLNQSLLRHFDPSEEECVRLGLPLGWRPQQDQIARYQLGTLAWMVAAGLLEVKIALPLDPDGKPYYPGRQGALYHPKAGLLYDEDNNILFFHGSVNETGAAWTRNREKFEVKRSWFSTQDAEDIADEIDEFEQIWHGHDPGLLVLPLPQAVKEYIAAFERPDGVPDRDALSAAAPVTEPALKDRIAADWLLQAPTKPGGQRLVLDPIQLKPFPHQTRVADRATSEYPRSFLFCDEVGLGKTIEAGLALRTLLLRGIVKRVLIIAPRNLIRQWMEELREKFALTAWFYDGRAFHDVDGRERRSDQPWAEDGIVIASRHLIARADRRQELLATGGPWDLVVVDEAHAARRKVMGNAGPNQLLSLLQDFRERGLCRSLWLLTATPMQLDPHEVHDLLQLCGLDHTGWGSWAQLEEFQRFFDRLRFFHRERAVRNGVIAMTRAAVGYGAPELFEGHVPKNWTELKWKSFVSKVRSGSPGLALTLQQMTQAEAEAITPMLARQTPLGVYMFRHTRATLRAYQERGLVQGLAERMPEDAPVQFRTDLERELYNRIDELCSKFYRLGDLPPEERGGVGFLMAVFRKRLASSLSSFRRSLERRRDLIAYIQRSLANLSIQVLAQEADEADEDDEDDLDVKGLLEQERRRLQRIQADPSRREQLEQERCYLHDYITALGQVPVDSKFEAFRERLEELLNQGHRVIVFTQYLDTLEFIRDRLVHRYGDKMACYSGKGGEVWDPGANRWRDVDKSEVKARTRRNHAQAINILLGTDAASEGLNLQQFTALINYDLPWNPMRVEQRIGRIDRIGQESKVVRVLNLYMEGTIEEDAYYTLKDRIGAFEEVVGPLQPILAQMPHIFRKVARGEIELREARRLLDDAARTKPESALAALDEYVRDDLRSQNGVPGDNPPVTQDLLAEWCLKHPAQKMRIVAVPEPGTSALIQDPSRGCFTITWRAVPPHLGVQASEAVLVTFNSEVADRHPSTGPTVGEDGKMVPGKPGVRLLTWGDPYLSAWLEAVRGDVIIDDELQRAGLQRDANPLVD